MASYVTSWERIALEKGIEQGIEKGIVEGIEEGRQQGIEQERKRMMNLLLKMLHSRFGHLPEEIGDRIESADSELIEAWFDHLLTAQTLDQVFERAGKE